MALAPLCDLFVVAGEASGDAYAAAIIERLRERMPDLVIAGMGGPTMAAAGVEIEQDTEGLAVMGFFPVLARLPEFIRLGRRVAEVVRSRRPRAVLTIDYPGFNLRLLRQLADVRAAGTRFIHVVAPQVWAWKPRRAKRIARTVDRLLCFFPFEPPLFDRFAPGVPRFVGHPLVDLIPTGMDCAPVARELDLRPEDRLLLIAPGSRRREVDALLPVFDRALELARPRLPAPGGRLVAAIAKAPELDREVYRAHSHLPLVEGRYRELCARAQVGLIASGTATLEAAIIGLPHVIAYRTDIISGRLARYLLRVEHIGLPNIVLGGERVCPEVLQDQLTPERLAAHLIRLWDGPVRMERKGRLEGMRARLGGGGAMGRISEVVAEELGRGRRVRDTLQVLERERKKAGG